jgi:hypothetical protein
MSAAKCETGWGGVKFCRKILRHPTPPLPDDAARRRGASTHERASLVSDPSKGG